MKTRMNAAAALLLGLLAVAASAQPASAAGSDTQVRTAVAHSAAGYLTTADRAALKTDPATAASVVDPARTTSGSETSAPRPATAADMVKLGKSPAVAASYWCRGVTAYKRYTSTTGITVYKFNNHVDWCYELNGTIHEITSRYWFLSSVSSTAEWQGLIVDQAWGLGTSKYNSNYQGHFKHCVFKYGCYGDSYPYVWLQVYSSGNYTYQAG